MSEFLSAEDVRQLTGYVKPSKQIQWLTRNRVPHYVNRFGRPVVNRSLSPHVARPELGTVR